MSIEERETPWLHRIEELIHALEGSTVGELELTEAGTQIIIRRRPDITLVSVPAPQFNQNHTGVQDSSTPTSRPGREERGIPVVAPLTGVYYSSPSPASPVFVSVGDVVQSGQVIALVEAMKVFNEIAAEVSGRVTDLVATNGDVVQKGDVLLRLEPL